MDGAGSSCSGIYSTHDAGGSFSFPGTSRGFSQQQGHLFLLCSESPYKTPKPRAEISFSSRELLLGLCLPLPSLCAVFAAVNPKPGCSFTNSSCHSPLTQSWNCLSGTPQGLCLPKCFLPSLVSAIDFFSLIWVCFEHVSVPHHLQLTVQGV